MVQFSRELSHIMLNLHCVYMHVFTAGSVGTYNGIKATKLCTAMKNTVIDAQEGEVPK